MLGEIYAQALAAAGYDVETELNLGDEKTALKALESGEIDAYPEYTGTALLLVLRRPGRRDPEGPAAGATRRPRQGFAEKDLTALPPTPFTSSNEVAVTKETADELGLQKISDLEGKSQDLTLYGSPGVPPAPGLPARPAAGLRAEVQEVHAVDIALRHEVLDEGPGRRVDRVHHRPADQARGATSCSRTTRACSRPTTRRSSCATTSSRRPGRTSTKVVAQVNKGLTDEVMQELNARVDLDKKTPEAGRRRVPAGDRARPVAKRRARAAAGARLSLGRVSRAAALRGRRAAGARPARACPPRSVAALRDARARWPRRSARWPCAARPRSGSRPPTGWRSRDDRRCRGRSCCASTRPDRGQPGLGASSRRSRRDDPLALRARAAPRAGRRPTGALAELGAARFEPGDRALTHCNAGALATGGYGTAGGVLRAAWEQRPAGAGLGRRDAPAAPGRPPDRLGAGAARASRYRADHRLERRRADGARRWSTGSWSAPTGSRPTATSPTRSAPTRWRCWPPRHGVPFYVAAPLSTLDPATPTGAAIPIEERDAGRGRAPGRPALNLAFDVTPGRAGDRDRHRGRRARGALRGGDRALSLGAEIVAAGAGDAAARPRHRHRRQRERPRGRACADHAERAALRGDGRDDLVTLGPDGAVVAGEREPSSEWRVHVAVYAARPGRPRARAHAQRARDGVERARRAAWAPGSTAPYFADAGSDEIATAAVAALGDREAVLLGRHGVLAVGETPASALEVCVAVEEVGPPRHAELRDATHTVSRSASANPSECAQAASRRSSDPDPADPPGRQALARGRAAAASPRERAAALPHPQAAASAGRSCAT